MDGSACPKVKVLEVDTGAEESSLTHLYVHVGLQSAEHVTEGMEAPLGRV